MKKEGERPALRPALRRPVSAGRGAFEELRARLREARLVRAGSEARMAGFHLGAATPLPCALVLTVVRLG